MAAETRRPAGRDKSISSAARAIVGGAGFFAAAMLAGVLAQPWPRWRVRLRAAGAAVGVAATVGAVAGERWSVVSRAITDRFAELNTGSFGLIAVVAVAAAGTAALLVRRMLPHLPAGVVRAGSARAGTVLPGATPMTRRCGDCSAWTPGPPWPPAPINPADQGPDVPVTAPPWLLTRAGSVLLGLVAAWPTLQAVYAGDVHTSTFGAQVVFAAVVLGGYLMIAVRSV